MAELDNRAVAAVFAEMADLLDIEASDTFRVRAFQRTAKVIEALGEPVRQLMERGALDKMPGVGGGSVHRIKQILRTGTCDDLVRLRVALPAGLRDLLALDGVGPKTVRVLWQNLRVGGVDELEQAIRAGRLAGLPRMGERAEERLLASIAAWRIRASRVPLYKSLRTGHQIIEHLVAGGDILRIELGGSARRGKATVGDLDVLVAADDGARVVHRFATQPGVAQVLWSGEGRCSVRLEGTRQQVDLRVIPAENWGAGLHYFTGSQQHNIAIRLRANKLGLRVGEHGVYRRDDDARILAVGTEEELFAALGLAYIPPELREDLGEIEAAEQGRLPKLVEAGQLRGDLHCHTRESDGTGTIDEMLAAAHALGLDYLAITEHSKSTAIANGLDERRAVAHAARIADAGQKLGKIHALRGIEVDILADGSLDLDPQVLRDLDWVVGSVHAHFELPPHQMTERIVKAMESGLVDVIGHPTGRMLGQRDGYALDWERILAAAHRTGVALEVNGSPKRMDLEDLRARQCRDAGVPVCINTDAHSPEHLPRREFGLAVARRAWLEAKDVVNCWPATTLAERRRSRLRSGGHNVGWATPAAAPSDGPAVDALPDATLEARLRAGPVDADLRARLETYLVHGDPEIEGILQRLDSNPMQHAFQLLASAPDATRTESGRPPS